jgi:hypothetical protein
MKHVYISNSPAVGRAVEMAVGLEIAPPKASQAEKLNLVIEFAEAKLSDEVSLKERIRAYDEIARDTERSEAIRASVLDSARHGLI